MPFCTKCETEKSDSYFPKNSKEKTAFEKDYKVHCKECRKIAARAWRAKNSGRKPARKLAGYSIEERKWLSAVRIRLKSAVARSKRFNRSAPTVTDLELFELLKAQDFRCALSGADLSFEKGHPLCLSLDQKKASQGYTRDNVQWLAWCVNRAKGDLDQETFLEMCKVVTDYALS